MEKFTLDRIVAFIFMVIVVGFVRFGPYPFWSLTNLGFMFIALAWGLSGNKDVPIGWKAEMLFFGKRMPDITYFNEGWHWIPWPLGLKMVDCRKATIKLDEIVVITKDNVLVKIEGAIIRQIVDLDQYFDVDDASIKEGFDNIWDQELRAEVRKQPLKDVLGMHLHLKTVVQDVMIKHVASTNVKWGIEVLEVLISGIKPADEDVLKDMTQVARENMQKKSEAIEIAHVAKQVMVLMKAAPKGPGLSKESALEQVQLTTKKATKTIQTHSYTIDAAILEAASKLVDSWRK